MHRRVLVLALLVALTAVPHPAAAAGGGCGNEGDVVADDDDADGGAAGTASEVLCFRAADDAADLHVFLDLAGTGWDPALVDDFSPIMYDVYLTTLHGATPVRYLVEVQYNGTELRTIFLDPVTFLLLPHKTATAAWEGSTIHLRIPRAEIGDPAQGDVVDRFYADVQHCLRSCSGWVHDDYAPDDRAGSYTFGAGSPDGKGRLCPTTLHDDANGDGLDASGAREITRFAAAEDAGAWTLCLRFEDVDDLPSDTTRVKFAWKAEYEAPGVAYEVIVLVAPDGSLDVRFRKGSDGVAFVSFTDVPHVEVKGEVLVVTLAKSAIGAPAAGESATGVWAGVGSETELQDRAPDSGAVTYTFG